MPYLQIERSIEKWGLDPIGICADRARRSRLQLNGPGGFRCSMLAIASLGAIALPLCVLAIFGAVPALTPIEVTSRSEGDQRGKRRRRRGAGCT
jgi:hypothetical protein